MLRTKLTRFGSVQLIRITMRRTHLWQELLEQLQLECDQRLLGETTKVIVPVGKIDRLAVLALAGSLDLGAVLAFLREYVPSFKGASVAVPASEKTPSHEDAGRVPSLKPDSVAGIR